MISNILEKLSHQTPIDTGYGWTFGLLGLLGLIAVPIVILIYLIKSKYVPKTVSSTFIWKRSLKYMKRRIPINFIMSLLLIVQLLAIVAATFALMDVRVEDEHGDDKIIIIDASASMTLEREAYITTASGVKKLGMGTRYDYALNRVEELTAETSEESGVCIIFAGDSPQLLTKSIPEEEEGNTREVPYIYDPARMQDILGILGEKTCSDKATDLNKALDFAREAIDTSPEAKIYLLTDRERSSFLIDENANIEIISCSDPANDRNVGVISFVEKRDETTRAYSFNVTVNAQGKDQAYSIDVIFELDGKEMDRKKLSLTTNSNDNVPGTATVTFGPIKVQQYERARVRLETDRDIIWYDDESYLYFVPEHEIKVLYVSDQLKYKEGTKRLDYEYRPPLLTALRSEGIAFNENNIIHADNIAKAPVTGYNLYVYEGTKPEKLPTDGAIWYFDAQAGIPTGLDGLLITEDLVEAKGTLIDEAVLKGEYASKILQNVNYGKEGAIFPPTINSYSLIHSVQDESGFPVFVVPDGFDVLFTVPYEATNARGEKKIVSAPVMLAGTVGTTRVVVSTFELTLKNTLIFFDADNFINLMENLVSFSSPDTLPSRTPFIGEKLQFNPPSGIESIKYVYYTPDEEAGRYTDEKGKGHQEYQWSKKDGEVLPNFTLKKFGLYELQVTYEPSYSVDSNGNVVENEKQTETFSIYTRAIDSEIRLDDNTLQELIVPAKGLTEAEPYVRHTSILPWVVLVLIVLLIIEWGVYYRDEY